jgi:trans-aconitate methyltransferase
MLDIFSKHSSMVVSSNCRVPKYFGKIPIIRWTQKWIKPVSTSMEYNFFGLLLDWVFEKYITNVDSVYEFGCGTGHNLLRIRDQFPHINLYGLDWTTASQNVIDLIVKETKDNNLFSKKFDYFNPDKNYNLNKNSMVLTVASLEQTGGGFKSFVDYLVSERPSMVVHIEPIHEVLDESNVLDNLSIKYFKKRNYLDGLVNYVRDLESKGIVKIHNLQRTYVGSFYIEGYSLLVWSTA